MEHKRQSLGATELRISCMRYHKDRQVEALRQMKSKLLSVPNLKSCLEDDFLLRFIIHARYDIDKAFKRLSHFYKTKKKYAKVFQLCYPSSVKHVHESKHVLALPFRAPDNSVILAYDRGLCDPQKIPFDDMFLFDTMVIDSLLSNEVTQEFGVTLLVECKNVGLRHIIQDTPKFRMLIDTFQNAVPVRIQGFHFVNAHYAIEVLYSIVSPFLTNKMKKRIHFHSGSNGWQDLHKFIPPEFLPEKYGGCIRMEEIIDLGTTIEGKDEHFKKQMQFAFLN